MPMKRDRYRNRFLLIGQTKHALTYPARKAYVTESLLYSAAERMHNRIHPVLYTALNARSLATQRAVERMREFTES